MIELGSLFRPVPPATSVEVLPVAGFRVRLGVCPGAPLGPEAVPGDVFHLDPLVPSAALILARRAGVTCVAARSGAGRPGAVPAVTGDYRLLAEDGEAVTILTLEAGDGTLILPLAPLAPGLAYTLTERRAPAAPPNAASAAVANAGANAAPFPLPPRLPAAFARGTTLVRACGTPCPVERLAPGDLILTRDNGAQPLRARVQARVRAAGEMAPVVFAPGTIGNAGELSVSPWHRILIVGPGATGRDGAGDRDGDGQVGTERFVAARHLVDGDRIRRRDGGFVDYHAPILDAHEVIFAEGLPVESLCLTAALRDRLPDAMRTAIPPDLPLHRPRPLPEATRADLSRYRR